MKTFKAEGDTFKQKARLRQLGWRWFPEKYQWRITVPDENHNAIRMLRRIGLTCTEVSGVMEVIETEGVGLPQIETKRCHACFKTKPISEFFMEGHKHGDKCKRCVGKRGEK